MLECKAYRERREDIMGMRDGRKVGNMRGVWPSAVEELLELEKLC